MLRIQPPRTHKEVQPRPEVCDVLVVYSRAHIIHRRVPNVITTSSSALLSQHSGLVRSSEEFRRLQILWRATQRIISIPARPPYSASDMSPWRSDSEARARVDRCSCRSPATSVLDGDRKWRRTLEASDGESLYSGSIMRTSVCDSQSYPLTRPPRGSHCLRLSTSCRPCAFRRKSDQRLGDLNP